MSGASPAQELTLPTEVMPWPGAGQAPGAEEQPLTLPVAPAARFPTIIQMIGQDQYLIPELFFAKPEGFVGQWTPPKKLEQGRHWPTQLAGGTWLYNGNNWVLHGFGQESAGWAWTDLG